MRIIPARKRIKRNSVVYSEDDLYERSDHIPMGHVLFREYDKHYHGDPDKILK